MSRHYGQLNARPPCPACGSRYVLREEEGYRCKKCYSRFARTKAGLAKSNGSGQIAGRITIPQYHFGWPAKAR